MNKYFLFTYLILTVLFTMPDVSYCQTPAQGKDLLQPDSAKECAICHYSWVDTFYEDHQSSFLAKRPETPEAAVAEMCYSCHDGSTVDSRKHIINDRKHQSGVLPSEKVTIPEIFPLDKDGKMNCATCHSAHGVSTEPGIERTIFLRTSNQNSEMCRMCHTDKTGGPEKGHHPLDKTTLEISDQIIRNGGYQGTEPNRVVCESCHVAHGGFTDKRLVLPIDRPSTHPVLCEACHGQTPGRNKDPDKNRFSHSVDIISENADIPENWQNSSKVRLGSKGEIVCMTCHATHSADRRPSLLNDKNENDSLCLQCHEDQLERISGTKHDLRINAPESKNIRGQTIAQSGPCSCCHLMHEGTGPFMWARTWTGNTDAPVGICQSCHDRGKCAEKTPIPETGHPLGISPDNGSGIMDFPLYTKSGKEDPNGRVYCSSCHNTHQWDPANIFNRGDKDTKGDRSNSFLRNTNTDSSLCLKCHKEKEAIKDTDHDLEKSAPRITNLAKETSAQAGLCGSCHLAHNGSPVMMWARTISTDNSTSAMTGLCTECHKSSGCADKKLTGEISHPIDVLQKEPADSRLPLYTDKGNKDPSGKVVCSSCHDSHQWKTLDPDFKSDEGTAKDSFLRLTASGHSPLCTACHTDQAGILGTDHDLRITGMGYKNSQDIPFSNLGLCSPCHTAHHAVSEPYLWNLTPGPVSMPGWNKDYTEAKNIMTSLCTECHREDSCGEKKIPYYGLHPNRLFMAMNRNRSNVPDTLTDQSRQNRFPLYTETGKRTPDGNIVCSTCHDPHLWSAHQAGPGPGKNTEGTAFTSFLRADISFSFCSACHGEDAIYKFKYYHRDKGRKKMPAGKQNPE